jgi:TM2 domain-containing membrane protein YozV
MKISWVVKSAIQVCYASLGKLILKAVELLLAQVVTGAIKLMRGLQFLVCGLALLAIMQQT